jgi:hypothetical protein
LESVYLACVPAWMVAPHARQGAVYLTLMIAMLFSFVHYDNKHYIMMQFEQWNEVVC